MLKKLLLVSLCVFALSFVASCGSEETIQDEELCKALGKKWNSKKCWT